MEFQSIYTWFSHKSSRPFLIAGPCSAESEEQLVKTAAALSQQNISLFRAGLWKPRTRPGNFEGVGELGLEWLKKIQDVYNLKVCVEVAFPWHVEKVLESGLDAVWIGARTTANPFSVQELGEALKGVDIPVLVKNPVNCDPDLWIGAVERIASSVSGQRIAAVHRGFSSLGSQPYRNIPRWDIPIELMRLFPSLPMICDPSHIAGKAGYVKTIAQRSMDLDMDGLMIETHIDPARAFTDSSQQLRPEQLKNVLEKLIIRERKNDEGSRKLENLREQIDLVDQEMISVLVQRMKLVKEMGHLKKDHGMTILQLSRWTEILKDRLEKGKGLGLERDFLKNLLQLIHRESVRIQTGIFDDLHPVSSLEIKDKKNNDHQHKADNDKK